jgi:hypothetical protein
MDEGDYRGFTFSMRHRWINFNNKKTKQNKTNQNEDSFSDALNYNHILKEYMSKKKRR